MPVRPLYVLHRYHIKAICWRLNTGMRLPCNLLNVYMRTKLVNVYTDMYGGQHSCFERWLPAGRCKGKGGARAYVLDSK